MSRRKGPKVVGWCPECGPIEVIDEDGCCPFCGCTARGPGAEKAMSAAAKPKRGGNRGKPAVDARIDARLAEQAVVKAAVRMVKAWHTVCCDDSTQKDSDRYADSVTALHSAVEKLQRKGRKS